MQWGGGGGGGGSDGAMVLGKLPVPRRPTNMDSSRARALSSIISFLSPSLWETARYRLKYCLKGPLSPKQPINTLQWQRPFRYVNGQFNWGPISRNDIVSSVNRDSR